MLEMQLPASVSGKARCRAQPLEQAVRDEMRRPRSHTLAMARRIVGEKRDADVARRHAQLPFGLPGLRELRRRR